MELKKKREELEKKLEMKEKIHYGKNWGNEGAYQDSVLELRTIYSELEKVAEELGDPIPVWL
tara:strand:- start:1038 stop:1223 length:186 start_codon:yes stop_codon:yes gene_type:complete